MRNNSYFLLFGPEVETADFAVTVTSGSVDAAVESGFCARSTVEENGSALAPTTTCIHADRKNIAVLPRDW